ncbi:hypothetical protein H0A36_26380 [Endozoicomonas sp. SM1973]|uniref:Uncharacterized protein n=1 Tax=Spartinivicinus marinus TaxID=2994442 RepID=A0A853IG81_9GAMM|nr:hypothetical protein [Spartinivicinus marinus]MCX4030340.1 hypothetical protein [Spartinivicinus marinus]NYZ69548.1 hypothetical protein [Spartinivicinus marinus]
MAFGELESKFTRLGERFSKAFSDGGMSIEFESLESKPTVGEIKHRYRLDGLNDEELDGIEVSITNKEELVELFDEFYSKPKLGYSSNDALDIVDIFLRSVDGEVYLVCKGFDDDCGYIDLLSSSGNGWYLFKFYYQFD